MMIFWKSKYSQQEVEVHVIPTHLLLLSTTTPPVVLMDGMQKGPTAALQSVA
jgi:hypothetical protein